MEVPAKILVVDDDRAFRELVRLTLGEAGYQVLTAKDGAEALAVLHSEDVDLILADIAMPRMNGYQLFERVREHSRWVLIPFVFWTGREMDSDIRYGIELGADDYLTKSADTADVLAVIRGKLRRAQQLKSCRREATKSSHVIVGSLRIDSSQHCVWMREEPVRLSATEFSLLEYMARRTSQVLSLQELVQVTHGLTTDRVEAGSLLRPLIRSLRRKLGYSVGDSGCIENVRGVGYRLIKPVRDLHGS